MTLTKSSQSLIDPGVLISGSDEGFALFLEDTLGALGGRVDQSDDLETGAKFMFKTEGVVPRALVGSEHDVSCADEHDGKVVTAERGDLVHSDEEGGIDAGTA